MLLLKLLKMMKISTQHNSRNSLFLAFFSLLSSRPKQNSLLKTKNKQKVLYFKYFLDTSSHTNDSQKSAQTLLKTIPSARPFAA